MKKYAVINSFVLLLMVALLMTACSSVEEPVSNAELLLTFDGVNCTYEGPTLLKAGPATFQFNNNAEEFAAADLAIHRGDETIQDAIDYVGEEPSTVYRPTWAFGLGIYQAVSAGESLHRELDLKSGTYQMVCINMDPHLVWFGTGLTVVD
jgi:hypothetical protein